MSAVSGQANRELFCHCVVDRVCVRRLNMQTAGACGSVTKRPQSPIDTNQLTALSAVAPIKVCCKQFDDDTTSTDNIVLFSVCCHNTVCPNPSVRYLLYYRWHLSVKQASQNRDCTMVQTLDPKDIGILHFQQWQSQNISSS